MTSLVDLNLAILAACGFTEEEIPTIAPDPVRITLGTNALPKIRYSRRLSNGLALSAPEAEFVKVDARILPVDMARVQLLSALDAEIKGDPEFADQVLEVLRQADLEIPEVDETGGLVVTDSDDNQEHDSESTAETETGLC